MAVNPVTDAYMYQLLKRVYKPGVTNNKVQGSPTLSKIKRTAWEGGESLQYATQYGNGGDVGASFGTIVANPSSIGAQNAQWSMNQGHLAAYFNISQPEILTSDTETGAYMKVLDNKMSATFDRLAKVLAIYLFGGKYGVVDSLKEGYAVGDTTLDGSTTSATITGSTVTFSKLPQATALKLQRGMRFQIASAGSANAAVPGSALVGNGAYFEVVSKTKDSVTATVHGASGTLTVYVGDFIELFGARANGSYLANATAVGPEGLPDLIPSIGNRDASDARWTNTIKAAFRGIDRSVAEEELAGQFVLGDATGKMKDMNAITELLSLVKGFGGGQASKTNVIVNNVKWGDIGKELGINAAQWQAINSGNVKNRYTNGVSELSAAFGDAFTDLTMDLYCPYDTAFMYDSDDLTFYDIGNVGAVINPVSNDQLGKYEINAVGNQGIGDNPSTQLNIKKLFSIADAVSNNDYSEEMRITAHIYGNFMLERTSSSGVVKFR